MTSCPGVSTNCTGKKRRGCQPDDPCREAACRRLIHQFAIEKELAFRFSPRLELYLFRTRAATPAPATGLAAGNGKDSGEIGFAVRGSRHGFRLHGGRRLRQQWKRYQGGNREAFESTGPE